MKIRRGYYTIYRNVELSFSSVRYESYLSKNEIPYSVCYSIDSNLKLEDFIKHPFKDEYCKTVLVSDLSNLYYVQTFGLYKGMQVEVFEFKPDLNIFHIYTNDKLCIEKYSFIDMANGKYGKDIKLADLEKLWEERKLSEYGLPMPEGIEFYKEIKII